MTKQETIVEYFIKIQFVLIPCEPIMRRWLTITLLKKYSEL